MSFKSTSEASFVLAQMHVCKCACASARMCVCVCACIFVNVCIMYDYHIAASIKTCLYILFTLEEADFVAESINSMSFKSGSEASFVLA